MAPSSEAVSHATTDERDPRRAVDELRHQLPDDSAVVLAFCSPDYPLEELGGELCAGFEAPVHGCTAAGLVAPDGMRRGGIVATAFARDSFEVESVTIGPLSESPQELARSVRTAVERLQTPIDPRPRVGVLLVDGLAMREEIVAATLYSLTSDLTIIGGSAGDDLAFRRTSVLCDGHFATDCAQLVTLRTDLPLGCFKIQHHRATEERLVVTAADPLERRVYAINGRPAASEYARLIGQDVRRLDHQRFALHPVAMLVEGSPYLRSIRSVGPDGSMDFYCAIEEGVVLRLARAEDPVESLSAQIQDLESKIGTIAGSLLFDCVLRRFEYESSERTAGVDAQFKRLRGGGFFTYGEQYNALHMNQTLVGLAFGERAAA